mmetsp:Transcript_10118/g.26993  ORF Transcript_10118/g.26993 Transcript_10118/m.26993 type:complete len:337 (+) Transcript_10118:597-1607(+)
MHRIELLDFVALTHGDLRLEHTPILRDCALRLVAPLGRGELAQLSPSRATLAKKQRIVTMADSHQAAVGEEEDLREWQLREADRLRGRVGRGDVNKGDRRVVRGEREGRAGGVEAHVAHPPKGWNLEEERAQLRVFAPSGLRLLAVDRLDVRREDAALVVHARRRNDHRGGWVPRHSDDGRRVVLDLLAHPEVVVRVEAADRDHLRAAPHRKLLLVRTPFDARPRIADVEDDEVMLPGVALERPDVSVPVLRRRQDAVRLRGPRNLRHQRAVLVENMLARPHGLGLRRLLEDVDLVVVRADGDHRAVRIPRVARDLVLQTDLHRPPPALGGCKSAA